MLAGRGKWAKVFGSSMTIFPENRVFARAGGIGVGGGEICAVSSVVEHYLDTVGVTGSNPVSRTIL